MSCHYHDQGGGGAGGGGGSYRGIRYRCLKRGERERERERRGKKPKIRRAFSSNGARRGRYSSFDPSVQGQLISVQ